MRTLTIAAIAAGLCCVISLSTAQGTYKDYRSPDDWVPLEDRAYGDDVQGHDLYYVEKHPHNPAPVEGEVPEVKVEEEEELTVDEEPKEERKPHKGKAIQPKEEEEEEEAKEEKEVKEEKKEEKKEEEPEKEPEEPELPRSFATGSAGSTIAKAMAELKKMGVPIPEQKFESQFDATQAANAAAMQQVAALQSAIDKETQAAQDKLDETLADIPKDMLPEPPAAKQYAQEQLDKAMEGQKMPDILAVQQEFQGSSGQVRAAQVQQQMGGGGLRRR